MNISIRQLKQRWQQRKTHKFYRCPKCKTVLRVPRGKGKLSITAAAAAGSLFGRHKRQKGVQAMMNCASEPETMLPTQETNV